MNYLAHGFRFLDQPPFAAGTAVPDWLSVVDRQVRVRSIRIQAAMDGATGDTHLLLAGMLQHLTDDDAFHRCTTFHLLEAEIGAQFRRQMPDPFDHRPGFLGHIVTELMLDAIIAERDVTILDRYYDSIALVDSDLVQNTVNRVAARQTDQLVRFIRAFLETRFLYDYLDDGLLLGRLNQVLRRVKLPVMDDDCIVVLQSARRLLRVHADSLLAALHRNSDTRSAHAGMSET